MTWDLGMELFWHISVPLDLFSLLRVACVVSVHHSFIQSILVEQACAEYDVWGYWLTVGSASIYTVTQLQSKCKPFKLKAFIKTHKTNVFHSSTKLLPKLFSLSFPSWMNLADAHAWTVGVRLAAILVLSQTGSRASLENYDVCFSNTNVKWTTKENLHPTTKSRSWCRSQSALCLLTQVGNMRHAGLLWLRFPEQ